MEYRIILSGTVTKEYIEKVATEWLLVDPLRFLRQPGVSTNNGFGAGSRVGFDDAFQRAGYSAFPRARQTTPPVLGQAPSRSGGRIAFGLPAPTHPVGPANNHLSGHEQCNVGEFHIAPQIRLFQLSEMGKRQVHTFVLNDREVLVVQQAGMHHQWIRLKHNWESPHTLQAAQAVSSPVVQSDWDRLWAAMQSGVEQLPAEAIASVKQLVQSLFTWQGFLLIVAVTALFILGGEVALLLMGAVAVYDLLMNVLPLLVQFYHAAIAATTPEQTQAAGKIFAQALLNGALDVVSIYFAAGAYNRLRVLGRGQITFRAVIAYLVERSQMLMARLAQGAGKLKQLIQEAREAIKKKPKIKTAVQHLDDLGAERNRLGLPPAGSATDDATIAKIKIGDDEFYGANRKYQNPKTSVTVKANAQTKTHAEAEAVQKAIDAGKKGAAKEAEMWVDRDACDACGKYNGIGSLARELGVEKITVHSPSGTTTYYPPKTK